MSMSVSKNIRKCKKKVLIFFVKSNIVLVRPEIDEKLTLMIE